jgi:sporulation protein YqfC
MRRLNRKIALWSTKLLDLPQDVTNDMPRVTIMGNLQVVVENHHGVKQFTDEYISLVIEQGSLEIVGQHLIIRTILSDIILVEGKIEAINFT